MCTTGSPSPDLPRRSRRSRPWRPGPGSPLAARRGAASPRTCFSGWWAPPPPQQRSLSLAGARILAGQLRDAVARRHDLALARVGHSRACPFDLHALLPVPADMLRRGPDDPVALAWLWAHWGTTDALRHVTAARAAVADRRRADARAAVVTVHFWSADWSPWRALAAIGEGFPGLRFDLQPSYDEAR